MEYKGVVEISQQDIPTRGKYAKIAMQAINDFQIKGARNVKVDVYYANENEFRSLYNALKSIVRRKKLQIRVSARKDKITNKKEIYLSREEQSYLNALSSF